MAGVTGKRFYIIPDARRYPTQSAKNRVESVESFGLYARAAARARFCSTERNLEHSRHSRVPSVRKYKFFPVREWPRLQRFFFLPAMSTKDTRILNTCQYNSYLSGLARVCARFRRGIPQACRFPH